MELSIFLNGFIQETIFLILFIFTFLTGFNFIVVLISIINVFTSKNKLDAFKAWCIRLIEVCFIFSTLLISNFIFNKFINLDADIFKIYENLERVKIFLTDPLTKTIIVTIVIIAILISILTFILNGFFNAISDDISKKTAKIIENSKKNNQ